MKILYSCLSRSWGGMEMFTLQAVGMLMNRGIETELLCYPLSRIHNEALKRNFKVHTIEASGYFHPAAILKLIKILKHNFTLVHTQASKDLWVIVPALKLASLDIPLIITKQVGSYIVKKDFFHRWIYNRVDKALAISTVIKKNLIDTCPLTPGKIEILYNGIDIRRFNPSSIDKNKIRREFGIKQDELVIGMLARFSPGKGHEEFLLAGNELLKKYPHIRLLIVGEPSRGEDAYFRQIRNMSEELLLKDNVIFTGFRSDTPEILSSMDIFVFPSHAEAFGIALAEAMAMERPSVCSDSDGILDIAVDGTTSYFFSGKNFMQLSEKIEMLVCSGETRKKFGENARLRVIEKFDIEKLTDNVIEIYNKLQTSKI